MRLSGRAGPFAFSGEVSLKNLVKQVRTHPLKTGRPVMGAMIQEVTGVKVLSLHHGIRTITGEEVVLFTLNEPPGFRELRKR